MVYEILLWVILAFTVLIAVAFIVTKEKEYAEGVWFGIMSVIILLAFIWCTSPAAVYRSESRVIDTWVEEEVNVLYTLTKESSTTTETSGGGFFLFIVGSYSNSSRSYTEHEYSFMVENDDGWIQPQSVSLNRNTEGHIFYREDNNVEPTFILETTYEKTCIQVTREPRGLILNLLYRKEVGDCIMTWISDSRGTNHVEEFYFIVPEGSIRREYKVN